AAKRLSRDRRLRLLREAPTGRRGIGKWRPSNSPTRVANELLYRHDEERIEVVELGRPWSFDGDGSLFRLVSEAHRIHLAHLFDPVLAVHTSVVDPLPHHRRRFSPAPWWTASSS